MKLMFFLQNTLGTVICPFLLNAFCNLLLPRLLWAFSYPCRRFFSSVQLTHLL